MTTADGMAFGRYRVIRELGRGGEAVVYLAEDPKLLRRVAIKTFPLATAADGAGGSERSRREAEALSRLDHPGICRIHDTGVENGVPFIAMSYVDGETLDASAARAPEEAVRIAANVARIMGSAHAAGIVHGDLKPQNIAVARNGACFVLDFGVARFLDETFDPTTSERRAGTLPYLAPECVLGPPDERSDVYGLGAVLFELVTGRPPHDAPTRAALLKLILHEEAPLARTVAPDSSRDLDAVLAKALARNPGRRYASMADFAIDLERLQRGDPPAARRIGVLGRAARHARRRPWTAALAGFLVAFLVVAAGITLAKNRRLERTLERTSRESERSVAEALAAEAHFKHHARLADHRRLDDLERRARDLVPPTPAILPALLSWQGEAEALVRGLDAHRQALADLRHRGSKGENDFGPGVSQSERRRIASLRERHLRVLAHIEAGGSGAESRELAAEAETIGAYLARLEAPLQHVEAWSYESPADAWHDATLASVVEGLERFAGPDGAMRDVARRVDDVNRLAASLDATRENWDRARKSIADPEICPGYRGLVITPQFGLAPLERNASTGLWEFAHVLSGGPAPDRAVVLVLLPGGRARMGARRPRAGETSAAPHVDPEALPPDAPVHEVVLDPFFISKFELTRAQWARLSGARTSAESMIDAPENPVGDVSWNDAERVLARAGLDLPTEAQWEYAARAGTSSRWWTGDHPSSLSEAEWFGRPDMAAVGRLKPNAFGLFDVAGNVSEWCRDRLARYESPCVAGSGERVSLDPIDMRVYRGGSHGWSATALRSARRSVDPPGMRRPDLGVRPARRLDR